MKKLFSIFIFLGILSFSTGNAKAQQSLREPVSSFQKSDDGVLVAYPNPAKDFIIVKSKNRDLKIKQVTFYSILGVQVATFQMDDNSAQIPLDRLSPGKYLMRYVLSDNTQKVTQVIKL